MDARRKAVIAKKLRVALQTKRDAESREGFLRAATVEVFKTEAVTLLSKHGAELLAMLEEVSEEESTEPT